MAEPTGRQILDQFSSLDRRAHSAPPVQQPSAVQSLFGEALPDQQQEEAFRYHPEYAAYYAKQKALNPRLPPPLATTYTQGSFYDFSVGMNGPTSPPSVADLILGGGAASASGASSVRSVMHSDAGSLSGSEHTLDPGAVGLAAAAADASAAEFDVGAHPWAPPGEAHPAVANPAAAFSNGLAAGYADSAPQMAGMAAPGMWGAPAPAMHGHWAPPPVSGAALAPPPPDAWAPPTFNAPSSSPMAAGFQYSYAAAPRQDQPRGPAAGAGMYSVHAVPPAPSTDFNAQALAQQHMHMRMAQAQFMTPQGYPMPPQHGMAGGAYTANAMQGGAYTAHAMQGGAYTAHGHPMPNAAQYVHMGAEAGMASSTHALAGGMGSGSALQQLHAAVQAHSAAGRARGKRKGKAAGLDSVFAASPVDLVAFPDAVGRLAKDQTGSRYIQFRFERGSAVEAGCIAQQLHREFHVMARDAFGNYAVQKIMDNKRHKCAQDLVAAALEDCVSLSEHVYGCRVVQKALEVCGAAQWAAASKVLQEHLMRFVYHEHGNHVVQKWVQSCPGRAGGSAELLAQTVAALKKHASTLALHMYGCRVLQRLVEAAPQALLKKQLYPPLLRKAATLVLDQFGNFVLQHMLAHGDDATRAAVAKALTPGVVKAAGHKCASNVLERLLESCAAPEVDAVVWQVLRGGVSAAAHKSNLVAVGGFKLLQPAAARNSPVRSLLVDRFGNYVLQKALAVAPMGSRVALADAIRVNAEVLTSLSFGQAIVDRAMAILIGAGILRAVGSSSQPSPDAAATGSG